MDKTQKYKGLRLSLEAGYISRYHTERTLYTDTVGHHSYNVAQIILEVHPDASSDLLVAALRHDIAERRYGDIPAPSKRELPSYPENVGQLGTVQDERSFREVFGELENNHLNSHGVPMPSLTSYEEWLLKYADAMDGLRFCLQEESMGNLRVQHVARNYVRYIEELLADGPEPILTKRCFDLFTYFLSGGLNHDTTG